MNRAVDPFFAASIGIAAAAVRINREEKEKGHSTEETVGLARRRWDLFVLGRESGGTGSVDGGVDGGKGKVVAGLQALGARGEGRG